MATDTRSQASKSDGRTGHVAARRDGATSDQDHYLGELGALRWSNYDLCPRGIAWRSFGSAMAGYRAVRRITRLRRRLPGDPAAVQGSIARAQQAWSRALHKWLEVASLSEQPG
ncbi:MAG: hypothetical protein ACYTG2_10165 [Planctomycetota bacterium]|jgi:hypothetical protein